MVGDKSGAGLLIRHVLYILINVGHVQSVLMYRSGTYNGHAKRQTESDPTISIL